MSQKTSLVGCLEGSAAAGLLAMGLVAMSCTVETGDEEPVTASRQQDLYSYNNNLWQPYLGDEDRFYRIPVCYNTCKTGLTQAECDEVREAARRTMKLRWERYSRISFLGFDECELGRGQMHGEMRLHLGLGNDGVAYGIKRNSDGSYTKRSPGYHPNYETWVSINGPGRNVTLHEIGHGLGFMHEFLRSDEPSGTECLRGGTDISGESASGTPLTAEYDPSSIMSWSYCTNETISDLSPNDIVGLHTAYGRKWSGALVSAEEGGCLMSAWDIPGETNRRELRVSSSCQDNIMERWRYGGGSVSNYALHSLMGASENQIAELSSTGARVSLSDTPNLAEEHWQFRWVVLKGLGNLCMTMPTNPSSGSSVAMQICEDLPEQRFEMVESDVDHFYWFKSVIDPSLCLRATSMIPNSKLALISCGSGSAHLKRFRLDYGHQRLVVSDSSGSTEVCVDVNGGKPSPGEKAEVNTCHGAERQKWFLKGPLQNRSSNECLKVNPGYGNIFMRECEDDASQYWEYYP